jgi:hypothetical protein
LWRDVPGTMVWAFWASSIVTLIHSAQVGLAEAQQIKAAQKPNSSSAHPTQREAQFTQKTSPMEEGWLSLLKWLPPIKLSKVGLFWDTYRCTCGPRDLTILHRRDVGLRIEPYTTRSKDVLIILTPLNWALALIPLGVLSWVCWGTFGLPNGLNLLGLSQPHLGQMYQVVSRARLIGERLPVVP